MTLLHWACDRGYPDMVKALLRVEADINAVVGFVSAFFKSHLTITQVYLIT